MGWKLTLKTGKSTCRLDDTKLRNLGRCQSTFLAITNGKRFILTPEDPEWYKEFYSGMRHIMNSIVKLRPDLYALAKKSKDNRGTDYNIDGTTVNCVMCSLENKALLIAFDYLTEQEIEVGSFVFDGLMIYKDNVPSEGLPEILKGCSQKVKEVMGCNITFANQVIDEEIGYDAAIKELGKKWLESNTIMQQELEKKVDKIKTSKQQKIDALVERSLAMERQTKEDLDGIRMFMQLKHPAGKTINGSVTGRDIAHMFKPSPP
ncbi:unnamed protein product [Mytilus coruscus]|uniref:Uncharacterized protein n=1 Tax=Mytilus coruscus TaxID=42192 RepID=A0A6J8A8E5_MYTCO|nr:unnamed protein product [Mytilus coruscus]